MISYIPFTQSRRKRLFRQGLRRLASKGDGLVWIERADSTADMKPAEWNEEDSCWELEDGRRFYVSGKGGQPSQYKGTPIVKAFAKNAGVISTEFSVMATASENGDTVYVDEEGVQLYNVQETDDGRYIGLRVTDGEQAEAADEFVDLPEDYDGYCFSMREASEYDPAPVEEENARQAVENARLAERDAQTDIRTFMLGLGLGAGLIVGFIVLLWLMGQIGSGSVPIPATLAALPPLTP